MRFQAAGVDSGGQPFDFVVRELAKVSQVYLGVGFPHFRGTIHGCVLKISRRLRLPPQFVIHMQGARGQWQVPRQFKAEWLQRRTNGRN